MYGKLYFYFVADITEDTIREWMEILNERNQLLKDRITNVISNLILNPF